MTEVPRRTYESLTAAEKTEIAMKYIELAQKAGYKIVPKIDNTPKLRSLITQGWRVMYAELFGPAFVDVLAPHHIEAIEWHWESRLAFLEGSHPEYLAYFPIWSRGHMKSSVAERIVVIDAVLNVTFKQPGYALFVGRNKDKVQEHIANIETLLASEPVKKLCPALSTPKRTEIT